jgi:hypothetical protein
VLAGFLVAAAPVLADVTRTDVQVAARALSFISNPLSGPVSVGILYAGGNSRSTREAESLQRLLEGGYRIGAVELSPVLVELGDAGRADVDLFFLTEHVPAGLVPVLTDGSGIRALCVTTDLEQVRIGACTIGVRSRPKVEVFVSSAAAKASDITFSTVFRVMITEL